jgi:hypothetical protein
MFFLYKCVTGTAEWDSTRLIIYKGSLSNLSLHHLHLSHPKKVQTQGQDAYIARDKKNAMSVFADIDMNYYVTVFFNQRDCDTRSSA